MNIEIMCNLQSHSPMKATNMKGIGVMNMVENWVGQVCEAAEIVDGVFTDSMNSFWRDRQVGAALAKAEPIKAVHVVQEEQGEVATEVELTGLERKDFACAIEKVMETAVAPRQISIGGFDLEREMREIAGMVEHLVAALPADAPELVELREVVIELQMAVDEADRKDRQLVEKFWGGVLAEVGFALAKTNAGVAYRKLARRLLESELSDSIIKAASGIGGVDVQFIRDTILGRSQVKEQALQAKPIQRAARAFKDEATLDLFV